MSTQASESGYQPAGDALAACLAQVTRIFGQPATPEALTDGLPVASTGLTPELFIRAAERAGYATRLAQVPIRDLSKLDCPAVLLLRDRGACVLLGKNEGMASILTSTGTEKLVELDGLQADYAGAAMPVSRLQRFEAGTSKIGRAHV